MLWCVMMNDEWSVIRWVLCPPRERSMGRGKPSVRFTLGQKKVMKQKNDSIAAIDFRNRQRQELRWRFLSQRWLNFRQQFMHKPKHHMFVVKLCCLQWIGVHRRTHSVGDNPLYCICHNNRRTHSVGDFIDGNSNGLNSSIFSKELKNIYYICHYHRWQYVDWIIPLAYF